MPGQRSRQVNGFRVPHSTFFWLSGEFFFTPMKRPAQAPLERGTRFHFLVEFVGHSSTLGFEWMALLLSTLLTLVSRTCGVIDSRSRFRPVQGDSISTVPSSPVI